MLATAAVIAAAFAPQRPDSHTISFVVSCPTSAYRCTDCVVAGLPEDQPCGIEEVLQFQSVMRDYSISVFGDIRGNKVMVRGTSIATENNLKAIYLRVEGHYDVITSPAGCFAAGYFCEVCLVPYSTKGHRCRAGNCPQCGCRTVHPYVQGQDSVNK